MNQAGAGFDFAVMQKPGRKASPRFLHNVSRASARVGGKGRAHFAALWYIELPANGRRAIARRLCLQGLAETGGV